MRDYRSPEEKLRIWQAQAICGSLPRKKQPVQSHQDHIEHLQNYIDGLEEQIETLTQKLADAEKKLADVIIQIP